MFSTFSLRVHFLLVGLLGLVSLPALAQQAPTAKTEEAAAATMAPKRELGAVRITQAVKLDGVLDEEVWSTATPATDFIQNRPNPGPREKRTAP